MTETELIKEIDASLKPRVVYFRSSDEAGNPATDCDIALIALSNGMHIETTWRDDSEVYVTRLTSAGFASVLKASTVGSIDAVPRSIGFVSPSPSSTP